MEYGETHPVSDSPQDFWTLKADELTLCSQTVAMHLAQFLSHVRVTSKTGGKKFKTYIPRKQSSSFPRSRHLQKNSGSSNQDSLSPVQFTPLSSANISQQPPTTVLSCHVSMKACVKQPDIKEEQPVTALVFATVNSFNEATFYYLYCEFHSIKSCLCWFTIISGWNYILRMS
jgi:hypothetical protein